MRVGTIGQPDPGELGHGAVVRRPGAELEDLAEGESDVLQRGLVREEVEGLEDDPDMSPHLIQVCAYVGDVLTGEPDPAHRRRLEQVHASQQRRLARAGRADHDQHVLRSHLEVDPAQHAVVAEPLVEALDAQYDGPHDAHSPVTPTSPLRSRRSTTLTSRISGRLTQRYPMAVAT